MYEIKFAPPVDVTEEQARDIMEYMRIYYRMHDVMEIIEIERNDEPEIVAFYDDATDDEQKEILERVAVKSLDYEMDNDVNWHDAILDALQEE